MIFVTNRLRTEADGDISLLSSIDSDGSPAGHSQMLAKSLCLRILIWQRLMQKIWLVYVF